MSFDPNGEGLNVFALVIYVPDPLGRFLDDLRRELVPHDNPHAHVSVLPPRPLEVEWQSASSQTRMLVEAWPPFDVELTTVEVFPATDVIYLEVGSGAAELRLMHDAISTRDLQCLEPFPYHPHITLAQDIAHDNVPALHERAGRRWREFPGSRSFRVERAVFVQHTKAGRWLDLAEYNLGLMAAKL